MKKTENYKIVKDLFHKSFKAKEIVKATGLSIGTVKQYIVRVKKEENTYNSTHLEEKYALNKKFFTEISPVTILDPYCGYRKYWKTYTADTYVISSDKDEAVSPDILADAKIVTTILKDGGAKFDLVDIDPFGDPEVETIENAIQLAKKGIIFTFGGFFNLIVRFKRETALKKYGIEKPIKEVSMDDLINFLVKTGKRYDKELTLYESRRWKNCSRLYFKIK